jgi:Flp pilus assembly protein TadG
MKPAYTKFGRRSGSRRGTSMVEFAIAFPMLFAFFSGTFLFGYSFYIYNRLGNAVRNGARYASTLTYASGSSTPTTAYLTAVKNMVIYDNPAGGTTPVIPGLDASKVNVSVTWTSSRPTAIRVAISGYTINAVIGSFTLTGKPFSVIPYHGRLAGP